MTYRKYTKAQRAEIARALKAAKHFLWGGGFPYDQKTSSHICYAIDTAIERDLCSLVGGGAAKSMIEDRLHGHATLRSWIAEKINKQSHEIDHGPLQTHRHAWLDMLIKEFSA